MKQDSKQKPKIKIIVATHKQYWMPEDSMYIPLLVGAENNNTAWNKSMDSEGENISNRNPNYCELTGLYWAWKNIDAEYVGLVHYRRYFSNRKWWKKKVERILTEHDLVSHLNNSNILLPKPRHYWIETNYSHYIHAHHPEDLDLTRSIIQGKFSQYIPAFDRIMRKRSGHRFNMMVMKKEIFAEYCDWLFEILFTLETMLDISTYNKNDQRVFGFVGERLLDVWLEKNQYPYKELPYVFLEKQNWLIKGKKFLARKLTRTKRKENNR